MPKMAQDLLRVYPCRTRLDGTKLTYLSGSEQARPTGRYEAICKAAKWKNWKLRSKEESDPGIVNPDASGKLM
jgi:hypothetical protein